MRRFTVTVTTDGSGDGTDYSPRVYGKVHSVSYVKPSSGGYSDGVDFAITVEETGQTIWGESNVNATAHRAPRQPTHSQAGIASLYAALGAAVETPVALANDRIKIVVASGGAAKTGTFHFLIDN
jgi:hypothetical protein